MNAKKLKMFTFISGREVIAELVHDIDPTAPNAFVIKHALVIDLVPQGPHQYAIGLIPLSPADPEGEQRVYNHAVAGESVKIPDEMANAYIQRTTNIEIASASSLIALQ